MDLICGGNVVLMNEDILNLVEISSLLGCIGDMLKEPVEQVENINIINLAFKYNINILKLIFFFVI